MTMPNDLKQLEGEISELLFGIGYGVGPYQDGPSDALVDGINTRYTDFAAKEILTKVAAYVAEREVAARIDELAQNFLSTQETAILTHDKKVITVQMRKDDLYAQKEALQKP